MAAREEPAIRAAMSQLIWKRMQRRAPAELEAVSRRMAPGSSAAIMQPLSIGWVGMQPHMDMCEAIERVLGADRYTELWRSMINELGASRLLRGFFNISARSGIRGVIRRGDVAYASQTRGLGSLRCLEAEDDHAVLRLEHFPARSVPFSNYTHGLRGTLLACIDVCGGTRAVVEPGPPNPEEGSCRYELRWG